MNADSREAVLLLNGLWMNHWVMSVLASALERAGFAPFSLSYRSLRGPLPEHLERIENRIATLAFSRVHLIGHSMGGVLALACLMRQPTDSCIGRTVLLGTSLTKCQAAQALAQHAAGRWLLGRSVALWREPPALMVPPGREVGAIAGTLAFGLGPLVVRVEETMLPGIADHMDLPASHTGMLFSSDVAKQCVAFLQQGRFRR